MKEFFQLLDNLKSLYESELYEDVKIFADLLIGQIESASPSTAIATTSTTEPTIYDSKDKYTIYYWYGNAAFKLKEYKLAESLFNKALQINKSNLRSKSKTHVTIKRL
jgi:hypothetical protein